MPEWIEIIVRSSILLIALFLITKWLGKKQISQFNTFDYISSIVLGGIVAIHSSTLQYPLYYGLFAMLIWFSIPLFIRLISLKSKTFRDFTQGTSTIIIQNGKIMEDNLKKEGFSTDDLLHQLRQKDVFNIADVEFAVLEPSGAMSVLPKKDYIPPTAKDLGLQLAPHKEPQTVIMDGKVLLEPLANLSLNPTWLETELEKLNVSIENVFLGQVDHDDQSVVPNPTQKPLLLATMKKCQADLELFALATKNKQSKQMYETNSQRMQKAIERVERYLQ